MKKGWQTKRLGDVCEVTNGGTPKTSVSQYWDGSHMWITPAEMGKRLSPYVAETERRITDLGLRDSSAHMLPPYSVILSSRAPIGYLVINTEPMATNQGCKGLIPGSQIQHKFLYYYLTSIVDLLNELGSGATFKELSGGKLKEIPIDFPPLAEQRRIVGILDEAFEGMATAKANAEKNLENARAIFESHLQTIFEKRGEGWMEKKLEELSTISYGYTESACAEPVGPKFLRITDIQDNRVDWNTVPYCPIASAEISKYQLEEGDIVFARTGATTGKSYLITEPPKAVFASYLIRVQLAAKELLPPFLYLFFQTRSYWDSIQSGSSGSAQGGFNATKLGELVIPYPKQTKEQQSIIAKLNMLSDETRHLESIYQQKLDALDALKKSMLHQAFTGEL